MDPGKLAAAGLTALIGGWLVWAGLRSLSGVAQRRILVLAALRGVVVVLLVLAAIGPAWVRSRQVEMPAPVLVALDCSASMDLADTQGGQRRRQAVSQLLGRGGLLDAWAARRPVEVYRFSDLLLPLSSRELPRGGDITDLQTALEQLKAEAARSGAAAIVLVTDGVDTEGLTAMEAGRIAEGLPPVYAVPVGGRGLVANRRILGLSFPRRVVAGKPVVGSATVASPTEAGASLMLDWRTSDGQHGRAAAVLDEYGIGTARCAVTASRPGRVRLEAHVAPLPGDALPEDDAQAVLIDVAPSERRVVYLDGHPRPEFACLRRLLGRMEREVVVTMAVRKGTEGWWQELPHLRRLQAASAAEGYASATLYVLGDLGGEDMSLSALEALARRVRSGDAALLVLGGPRSPRLPSPVRELLPADIGRYGTWAGTVAAPSRDSPLAAPGQSFSGLPALAGLNETGPLRPASRVALRTASGQPVVLLRDDGQVRSALVATDSLYRWVFSASADEASAAVYEALWVKLFAWLLQPRPPRPVVLFASRLIALAGEPLSVEAEVSSSVEAVMLEARPEKVAAPAVKVGMSRATPGLVVASLPPLNPGRWLLRARATGGGRELGEDEIVAEVVRQSRETRWPGPNVALLAAIARATGGRLVDYENLPELIDQLPRQEKKEQVSWRVTLGRGGAFAVLLTALLLADWLLRRRWGLV